MPTEIGTGNVSTQKWIDLKISVNERRSLGAVVPDFAIKLKILLEALHFRKFAVGVLISLLSDKKVALKHLHKLFGSLLRHEIHDGVPSRVRASEGLRKKEKIVLFGERLDFRHK